MKLAARLRLSKAEAARLAAWATTPVIDDEMSQAAFDRLLYRQGPEGIATRLRLALSVARGKAEGDFAEMARTARIGKLLDRTENWKKPAFPISGSDALNAGIGAGPRVGEVLADIEQQWVDGNFTMDRATLLARLRDLV